MSNVYEAPAYVTPERPSRRGRYLLLGCGAFSLIGIMICAGIAFVGYQAFSAGQAEVDKDVDAFFHGLHGADVDELYETTTTPEFKSVTSKADFADVARLIRERLGPLKSKQTRNFFAKTTTEGTFADLVYDAEFEKGPATIEMRMKRGQGSWRILQFRVDSKLLRPDALTIKCPICGQMSPHSAKFCSNCGQRLPSTEDTKPDGAPESAGEDPATNDHSTSSD